MFRRNQQVVPAESTDAVEARKPIEAGLLQKNEPMELLLYWRSLARRKWWIIGFAAIVAVAAAIAVSFMTPIYRATVTLLIEQNRAKLVSIEEVYSGVSPNREHYQTQA